MRSVLSKAFPVGDGQLLIAPNPGVILHNCALHRPLLGIYTMAEHGTDVRGDCAQLGPAMQRPSSHSSSCLNSRLRGVVGRHSRWAYAESMHTAQQNQGGDYCQKRLSPSRGVAGELLVTDTILEPPFLSPKPGMVCFLPDFGQLV